MVERVADGVLDDARGFQRGELVLGLALEFRLADEDREHGRAGGHHVIGIDLRHAPGLVDALGMVAQAPQQRHAHAALMRAALRRRDRVAIGGGKSVLDSAQPGDGPFQRAVAAGLLHLAGEDLIGNELLARDLGGKIILEPVGILEHRLGGHAVAGELGRTVPANLDTAEKIGFRARHAQQPRGRKRRAMGAENLRIRLEAHLRAAPVMHLADSLERRHRMAALEDLAIQHLPARHLDLEPLRQGVDHGDADAVQAAGGLIDLRIELAARMQRGENHFERGLVREFRMRIHGDAASVVGYGQKTLGIKLDIDEAGMAGHGLVHGVVDDFGEEMVQRLFRRCRRYTCPGAGVRVQAPPAPRSSPRCSRLRSWSRWSRQLLWHQAFSRRSPSVRRPALSPPGDHPPVDAVSCSDAAAAPPKRSAALLLISVPLWSLHARIVHREGLPESRNLAIVTPGLRRL